MVGHAPHCREAKPSPRGEGGTAKAVTDEVEKKMDTSSVACGDSFSSRRSLGDTHRTSCGRKTPSPRGEGGTAKAVTDEVEKKMDTSSVAFGDSFSSRRSLIQSPSATASPQGEALGQRSRCRRYRRGRRPRRPAGEDAASGLSRTPAPTDTRRTSGGRKNCLPLEGKVARRKP